MPRDATYEEGYYNGLRQAMIEIYGYQLDCDRLMKPGRADAAREILAQLEIIRFEAWGGAAASVSRTQGKATP